MSQTDEEETSEFGSYVIDQESFGTEHSVLASKLALLAASSHSTSVEGNSEDQISVDAETQARLEALLEAAGIGKLSTPDGKAFADPEVLRRLSSSVSCALDEAAAALSKMKTDTDNSNEQNQRSLVEACSEGDVNTVRRLLFEGHNANETTEEGESLLALACAAGYYELVEVLLAMHANIDDSGPKGECTPLMEAASAGHIDVVRLLLSHGADVNARSNTGNTALTYACCGGFEEIVKVLAENEAELESHNENGHTPLMEAASNGHVGVAAILLQQGAGINTHSNEFKESALTLACYKGHLQMVRFLLQAGADQEHKTDEMHTALMEASMDGHVEVARLLLDSGAQVNMPADSFESPLTLAACGGHVELAELLIQRGAAMEEVNDEGYTPLMEASREGHEEMVALLLKKGAKVNTKTEETQETALTLACCGGFFECVEVILKAGADIEAGSSTPIMEAAQEGHFDLVKYLHEQGANVNAVNNNGETALTFSCEHGHTKVAEYLLANGSDLEHETDGGRTPLMKASRGGHLCTVQYLLSKGADVNRATKNNEHTVLSLACVCGHMNVIELLLCHGADPNFKLKDGSNLLLEASKGGHANVVRFLLDLPNFYAAAENSMVPTSSPDQMAPRVPTQSLPMVVPPHEPDQAPEFTSPPVCEHYNPSALFQLSSQLEGKLPQDADKSNPQMHAIYQQQLQYYQQQNPTANRADVSFNTAALVSHLLHQGSMQSSAAEQVVVSDQKQNVDKDVAVTVESFLRSMATDAAGGKLRTAESIVEEAKGKLSELEQRIKEAIEKNAQLKSVEMMQSDQLTKEKVEEIYKTREEQIHKKQKILEELQKVERELQLKTQQQLKEHYLDAKQGEPGSSASQRGKPDGEDVDNFVETDVTPKETVVLTKTDSSPTHETLQALPPDTKIPENYRVEETPAMNRYDPNLKLNNGTSGSFPQPAKDMDESFCQCAHHSCPTLSHPSDEAPTFMPPSTNYPTLEIESHTESNHDTPLTLAAAGGHDELVRLLLSRGANIEHRDKKGFTPLILAATAGHANVVASLLDANAEIEALSDRTKDTPLSLACSGGRLEAADMLLQRGANKEHRNVSDYTPLSLAASGGFVSVVKLLLHHGAEINSRTGSKLGISPLMLAAMNGHYECVQLLLDMGADINAQIETNRNTALTLACFQGRHNVVSLLVDRKANVEHRAKTGLTPLMEAASGGYAEVGRVLLDKGADSNAPPVPSSRDTALTIAADKGHYRFCELILSRHAQVEVKNKKGNTPLWLACNGGHLDVVMLLVGKGASVNACDNRGVSPLMAAFRKGHVQVVRWLAKEVSQFPSDTECVRYVATVSDEDLLNRTQQCMKCIAEAKELQAEEANKFASELLEEVSNQKSVVKDRKSKNAKRREKRRRKKVVQSTDEEKNDDDDDKDEDDHAEEDDAIDEVMSRTSKLIINDTARITAPSHVTPPTPLREVVATPSHTSPVSVAPILMTSRVNPTVTKTTIIVSQPVVSMEDSRVVIHPLVVSRPVRSRSPETRKKSSSTTNESYGTSPGGDASPRIALRKTRKTVTSTRSLLSHSREQPPSRTSLRVSSATYSSSARTTTARKPQRKEEGWKEVTKKYGPTSGNVKRMMIASNLISRVIGRGGCNINAIREITAAHIDIDKLKKGAIERTVTIKGTNESIAHSQSLITSLIEEEKTEHEIAEFIAKAQAEAAEQRAAQNKPPPPKAIRTVKPAPIPSKPAWTVPPSIVAQSTRQTPNHVNTNSTFKVGVWAPPTTEKPTAIATSSAPSKWQPSPAGNPPDSNPPTVETVKKALFMSCHAATTATTTVSFTRQSDKPISKPIQPVAPMMATKTSSSPATRILQTSYGPIGSGIPSRNQPQPIQRPIPSAEPSEESPLRGPELGVQNTPMSRQMSGPAVNGMMNAPQPITPHHAGMSSVPGAVTPQNQGISQPANANHPDAMSNQMYRTSLPNVPTPIGMSAEGTPRSNTGVTHVRAVNNNFANVSGDGEGFAHAQSVRSPTYSPFSSSFTPSAGSSALWNNGSNQVPPFNVQSSVADEKNENESGRNVVDQSKAPGYRVMTKSPNVAEDTSGASVGANNQHNNLETNSASSGSQQGSPSADSENSSKPRPIGTERAQLQRKINPTVPLTTVVSHTSDSIWAYDKLCPAQLGMEANTYQPEPSKYNNWSGVIGSTRNDGIITTATSSKPQVTPTEMSASQKHPSIENLAQSNPRVPQMINQPYPHLSNAAPQLLYGNQGRIQTNAGRFPPQASAPGRVPGTQAPIGTQIGANASVGVVGMQQQQAQHSVLQPIGSHLGGAGHLRGNVGFHQSQMQRNLSSNPAHAQQANQNHRFPVSFFHPEMPWQQQQQQHSVYNTPPTRHPAINPYQQRDPQHTNHMYGSLHSPYPNPNNLPGSNLSQNPVLQAYSNPSMSDVNSAYSLHPEPQTQFVRDGGQYYDGSNDFLFRNIVPNNYGNPPAESNLNWDPSLCRAGDFQSMNGVPDAQSAIRAPHGVEMDPQQNWKSW